MTDTSTTGADLLALAELAQAKARYCRMMDTKDWAGLADLLTTDVVVDLNADDPASVAISGRDEVLASVRAAVTDAITVHQVHAPEVDLAGDEAWVIWAVQERVKWANGTSLTAYGHYRDRWVRFNGRWQLAELRLTHLLMEFD